MSLGGKKDFWDYWDSLSLQSIDDDDNRSQLVSRFFLFKSQNPLTLSFMRVFQKLPSIFFVRKNIISSFNDVFNGAPWEEMWVKNDLGIYYFNFIVDNNVAVVRRRCRLPLWRRNVN